MAPVWRACGAAALACAIVLAPASASALLKTPGAAKETIPATQAPGEVETEPIEAALGHAYQQTVTYEVITRGEITADVEEFTTQAAETLATHYGWRTLGLLFEEVDSGGDFILALSADAQVPSFGGACTTFYSCRSGDYVVINQDRWLNATRSWEAADASLRDYRHMVVNHEVGHWLGHGHRGCAGPGEPAPVMMQQSKGLDGCAPNPWPLPDEQFSSNLGIDRFAG